jgi:phosphohistidine phosphatase
MKRHPSLSVEQAAVVPYRMRGGVLEVALITTSDGKRWILPKGWIDAGETAAESALREAEEEAGLRGRVLGRPIGHYRYAKDSGRCAVAVFVMHVTRVLDHWPEDHRRRRWLPIDDALERLEAGSLRRLVLAARRRLAG